MSVRLAVPIFLFLILAAPLLSQDEAEEGEAPIKNAISSTKPENTINSGPESLLFQEMPVVITPARIKQPIMESPSTITVLTREDIRKYGITSLTDILRNVPGVNIISLSATDRNVGIRGLNELASSRILSLVDGIPTYMEFYGITAWETLPVSVEEIERIEIIRGPGSALYGANAFDGVINIITDIPSNDLGTRMIAKLNHAGKISGSILQGEQYSRLGYRASFGWDSINGWNDDKTNSGRNNRFNGHLRYDINDYSNIHIHGSIANYQSALTGLPGFKPIALDAQERNIKADYAISDLKIQAFYRQVDVDGSIDNESLYGVKSDTIDSEFQHSFVLIGRNFVTWGLNYRFSRIDSNIMGETRSQNIWAAYIQDQLRLHRSLNITFGLRCDSHPLTGNSLSPRASVVYSPKREHAFRLSVGRAFRNPTFVHSYVSLDYFFSAPFLPEPVKVEMRGDEELFPEWITSHEFGYKGIFSNRVKCGIDIFYSIIKDLIDFDIGEYYAKDALFPGSPGGVIPSMGAIKNLEGIRLYGGETEMEISIVSWLSAYVNYSYQYAKDPEVSEEIWDTIQHRLNPALFVNPRRNLFISLFANYVGAGTKKDSESDSYIMINSSVKYILGKAEIGLSISNLLNDRHIEHPDGSEIGRSIVLNLTYQIH